MTALPTAGRTMVMGIVNVTPDSFSDGGRHASPEAALAHGRRLLGEGADIVDVGGESTRPGAARVSPEEELARVLPVVAGLAAAGAVVSIDTMRAEVAAAAVTAGAAIVNDVSGGLADPAMLDAVAAAGAGYVAMHWRAPSAVMHRHAGYTDLVAEVQDELAARRDAALAAGIASDHLALDPGLGFAKTPEQNWTLLAGLDALAALGHPLVIGASRKRFLGELLAGREPGQRDAASVALTALLGLRGVWAVRTHVVRPHADAIAVVERLRRETSGPVG